MTKDISKSDLYAAACIARQNAYAPYSGIAVGAALLAKSGKVYTGANIENSAYSPSVCAERVAVFSAVNAGEREFLAIAVVGGRAGEEPKESFPPCGVCRQVLSEFCDKSFEIVLSREKSVKLSELLPLGFGKEFLK
jgi:cytidine deaminase